MAIKRNIRTITSTGGILFTDQALLLDVSSGAIQLDLPNAALDSVKAGHRIYLIPENGDITTNNVTVLPFTGDGTTISGGANLVLNTDAVRVLELMENGDWVKTNSSQANSEFNWNRPLKALPQSGVNYGGTTIQEGLEAMYFPFLSATISLNGFGLVEVGQDITPQLVGTLTPNDEATITNREVLVNGSPSGVFASNSINQPAPSSITSNTTYQLRFDADNNGSPTTISSPVRTQQFIYPFLYGMNAEANLNQGNIYTSLTKLLQAQGDKTLLLNGVLQTIYFLYDDAYPNLSKIEDPNGFDVTGSFQLSTMDVDSSGLTNNYTKSFKVYKSAVTTVNNANYKFLF